MVINGLEGVLIMILAIILGQLIFLKDTGFWLSDRSDVENNVWRICTFNRTKKELKRLQYSIPTPYNLFNCSDPEMGQKEETTDNYSSAAIIRIRQKRN